MMHYAHAGNRAIIKYSIFFLTTTLLIYLYFVVQPAYATGLYSKSRQEIMYGHFDVAGYTFEPMQAEGNWRVGIALISIIAANLSFLVLIIFSAALYAEWPSIVPRERLYYVLFAVLVLIVLTTTYPASATFAAWIIEQMGR